MKNEQLLTPTTFTIMLLLHIGMMAGLWKMTPPKPVVVEDIQFVDLSELGGGGEAGGGESAPAVEAAPAPPPPKPVPPPPVPAPKPKVEAPKPAIKPEAPKVKAVVTQQKQADMRVAEEKPKPVEKPKPKVEPKPEPKPVAKVEDKPEPKPEPKPVPKAEAKPEPKPESKPAAAKAEDAAPAKTPAHTAPEGKGSGEGKGKHADGKAGGSGNSEGKGKGEGKGEGSGEGKGKGSGSGSGEGKGKGSGSGEGEGGGKGSSASNPVRAAGSIPRPPYPPMSEENGEEGTVVLSVLVAPGGKVQSVKVAKGSGHSRLDRAARQAAQNGHFNASQWTEFRVPVTFKLD